MCCFCNAITISGNSMDYPENIQANQKISEPSGNYPDYPETFQAIQILFRLSGNFPDHPEISRLSGNFPGYPETFRTIPKIFRLSGNFADVSQISQCIFKGYAQKLSGRAKTFWMAMPPCHPGFWVSDMMS